MKKILMIIVMILPMAVHAQKLKMRIADNSYKSLQYAEAVPHYEEIEAKHGDYKDVIEKLAICYRKMNDSQNAEKWFGKLVAKSESNPEAKLYYAEALAENGKYALAKEWYDKYSSAVSTDTRGKNFSKAYENMEKFYEDSANYKVEKIDVNSTASDFSPYFYEEDKLIFCSNRHKEKRKAIKRTFSWNKTSFLDLYVVEITTEDGKAPSESTPKLFSTKLNSKYHEGPITFLDDKNEKIIFTRNNFFNGKYKKSKDGTNKLKMYTADKSGDIWTNIKEFPHNNDEYSIGHPTISKDRKWLYFASDMPGSVGGVDIFRCSVNGDSFGAPENMGKSINTEGDEMFPHIDGDDNLYFSSEGLGGLGGLDIFMALKADEAGTFQEPFNVGAPLNSSKDDFGLIFNSEGGYGYFTSNGRLNGVGDDDIYKFYRKEIPHQAIKILVKTYKKDTEEGLGTTELIIKNLDTNEEKVYQTDSTGTANIKVKKGGNYIILAKKDDFDDNSITLSPDATNQLKDGDVVRVPLGRKAIDLIVDASSQTPGNKVPDDFKEENLKNLLMYNLYYDYNKYNIRPDAANTLTVLAELMLKFKDVNVTLHSHTDKRSTVAYNNWLSGQRAQFARNYLINKGVSANRIKISAEGKSYLEINCEDCDEPSHQWNRRTQYTLSIDGNDVVRSQKPPEVIVGGKK